MTKKIVSYDDVPAVGSRLPAAVQAEITALAPGSVSTNTNASIDSEIALFSGTTGKVLKRASGTGIARVIAGVLSFVTAPSTALVGIDDQQSLSLKTLLSPKINNNDGLYDGNGNQLLMFGQTVAAVNELKVSNAATTIAPKIVAQGDDANINVDVDGKGTGTLRTGGSPVVTLTAVQDVSNKRFIPRVSTITNSPTSPPINSNNFDIVVITGQTVDITGFTMTGTPNTEQPLRIAITGTAARAITWGSSFENGAVTLPTTTVTTQRLDVGFFFNMATGKFRCMASSSA